MFYAKNNSGQHSRLLGGRRTSFLFGENCAALAAHNHKCRTHFWTEDPRAIPASPRKLYGTEKEKGYLIQDSWKNVGNIDVRTLEKVSIRLASSQGFHLSEILYIFFSTVYQCAKIHFRLPFWRDFHFASTPSDFSLWSTAGQPLVEIDDATSHPTCTTLLAPPPPFYQPSSRNGVSLAAREVCSCSCGAENNFLNNKKCFVFDKQKRAGEWSSMPAIYKNRQTNKQIRRTDKRTGGQADKRTDGQQWGRLSHPSTHIKIRNDLISDLTHCQHLCNLKANSDAN